MGRQSKHVYEFGSFSLDAGERLQAGHFQENKAAFGRVQQLDAAKRKTAAGR
jgi:hypothetical protein